MEGRIEFKNIKFAYPTRPEAKILDNINLIINKKTKVALVGESGCLLLLNYLKQLFYFDNNILYFKNY